MDKFVILGTQRTGSTFIASVLGGHPAIACGLEWSRGIACGKRIKGVARALNGDFSLLSSKHREHMETFSGYTSIGFRYLFSSSPKYLISPVLSPSRVCERMSALFGFLQEAPNIRVVHIVRENHLNWLASMYLSKQTGAFWNKEYGDIPAVTIPVKEAEKRLRAKLDIDSRIAALEVTVPYCRISLETFSANLAEEARRVFSFLGVAAEYHPEPKTKKQQKRPLEEVIANIDELGSMIDKLVQQSR